MMTTTLTMTRKSYHGADVSLTIDGVTYKGRISTPDGMYSPDHWISTSLLQGISLLPSGEFIDVCKAIRAAYSLPGRRALHTFGASC